ncbi:glycosyltransferase [Aeromonas media]|uniref:glycosyltransferase n=1 Tax=Aeromonas media TaxID=651 RepID=UPI003D24B75F
MLINRTEKDIMASWLADEPIRVSICCITYKQEQYIAQAIDSFLMQKTMFPFEIIIGEDCGGDGTLSILSEYQANYPSIIKVITSEGNVGANANLLRVFNYAKGDYIAVCEGDDYWIDENKITRQYLSLRENKNVDICFTSARTLNEDGAMGVFSKHTDIVKLFTLSEVVRGGGGFMPTASLMFRKNIVQKIPAWFLTAPVGDFYLQVLGSLNGGAIYLPEASAVYRVNAISSWSSARRQLSKSSILSTLNGFLFCADGLERGGVSVSDVKYIKAAHETDAAVEFLLNGYFQEAKEIIVQSWSTKKWMGKMQIFIYIFRFFPKISSYLIKFKSKH